MIYVLFSPSGVDVLQSGFDAASFTSKAKIFDFSQDGTQVSLLLCT